MDSQSSNESQNRYFKELTQYDNQTNQFTRRNRAHHIAQYPNTILKQKHNILNMPLGYYV